MAERKKVFCQTCGGRKDVEKNDEKRCHCADCVFHVIDVGWKNRENREGRRQ